MRRRQRPDIQREDDLREQSDAEEKSRHVSSEIATRAQQTPPRARAAQSRQVSTFTKVTSRTMVLSQRHSAQVGKAALDTYITYTQRGEVRGPGAVYPISRMRTGNVHTPHTARDRDHTDGDVFV